MVLIFLLAILTTSFTSAVKPSELTKADKLRYDFVDLEVKLWKEINKYGHVLNSRKEDTPEQSLLRAIEEFGDRIQEEFPNDITHGLSQLENLWVWARAYSELRSIQALYETFRRFEKKQTAPGRVPSPRRAWEDLAETILNDTRSIPELIDNLSDLITADRLYYEAAKDAESDMICDSRQSPQQMLLTLYNTIAVTELKGYSMIQFSYMLLKLYGKGNFNKESTLMRKRFEERSLQSLQAVQNVMETSSRQLWKCDPKKHIKGETYLEITQLLQGYLQNEVDLNPEGSCWENCAEYTYTKSHGCFKNKWCRQQRKCEGRIINCQYIDSDMQVCPADPFSGRRYEYIEYENGRVLGRKQGCSRGTTQVDSWWRYLFWHCSYCFCLCDDASRYSDRYFNMRPYISDIENNRVVTGLRFTKLNRIIHLQIQEGKLLPRGQIDTETIRWVPIDNYKLTDKNVYNKQDYHTLTWESRAIDLDDIEGENGHLLTGVRFKIIGSHLNFEVYLTPFNFSTGKLIDPLNRSFWKDNPNTDASLKNPRTRLKLENPDIPIRSPSPSVMDSKSDQYLEFIHTDFDRDAAQTTVPFIDAQPVESALPVPLSGAGIYHKGRQHFGGFIGPKVITYNFRKHMAVEFPERVFQEPEEQNDIVPTN